jgi:arginine N-succinyltransferase
MLVVRPALSADLEVMVELGVESGPGMTNLPAEPELLAQKLSISERSFACEVSEQGDEQYLFLLEEKESRQVVGCCGIIATIGLRRPFYSFRVLRLTHSSQELGSYEPVEVLQMVEEYRGYTEIGTLYLRPAWRRGGNGRFLSLSRFMFIGEYPERFATRVMAELRGVQDEDGQSVFWNALGRRFFHMEFSQVDYLSAMGKYQFIADMMPKYPVYVRLLAEDAQEVIGVPHAATVPALKLLEGEGFRYEGCVDVFDAGPAVHCPVDQIRSVRESRTGTVGAVNKSMDFSQFLVCNCRLPDFRVARGQLLDRETGLVDLSPSLAEALGVSVGDRVRFVRL